MTEPRQVYVIFEDPMAYEIAIKEGNGLKDFLNLE
jgi:hypothetical protein